MKTLNYPFNRNQIDTQYRYYGYKTPETVSAKVTEQSINFVFGMLLKTPFRGNFGYVFNP